jgi:sugar phosphate isomerase/epimerase
MNMNDVTIMDTKNSALDRRQFIKTMALTGAGLTFGLPATGQGQDVGSTQPKIKLGLDNFAVRSMRWKAPELIDYAAKLKTDSLFISDLGPFESFDEKYLKEVKAKAADKGLQIHLGSWSICPTSKSFRNTWGTAEQHLTLGLRVAKALGSPVFRVILGNREDRKTEGGIEARIEDTVKVCKACRSQAVDAGVKIAVENHAGDMQAWELVTLIEAAGKDYVGANIDSGNAVWTFEDPLENLEILGPYVVTTSLRDSAIWESPNGAMVQWTAMGEGSVDFKAYIKRFAQLCPGVPVHIETISGGSQELAYFKKEFWNVWPKARARDFAKFVTLAKQGKPAGPSKSSGSNQEKERAELERSIQYCKEVLGLGLKA